MSAVEQLKGARSKTVGTKQTSKAVRRGAARVVYLARDAEQQVIQPLLNLCQQQDVEVVWIDSMKELGKACGVEVGAASAAIVE